MSATKELTDNIFFHFSAYVVVDVAKLILYFLYIFFILMMPPSSVIFPSHCSLDTIQILFFLYLLKILNWKLKYFFHFHLFFNWIFIPTPSLFSWEFFRLVKTFINSTIEQQQPFSILNNDFSSPRFARQNFVLNWTSGKIPSEIFRMFF